MSQTWTIIITENGPQGPPPTPLPGDWVVWENQTSEWYALWNFAGPPPLFEQEGYTVQPWASSGGRVNPDITVETDYSYKCNSPNGGGIIIVQPPHGGPMQQTTQGTGAKSQANNVLVTNGSR